MNNLLLSWLNLKEPYSDDVQYIHFVTKWSGYHKPESNWFTKKTFKHQEDLILFSKFKFRNRTIQVWGSRELQEYQHEFNDGHSYIYGPIVISLLQKLIRRQSNKFAVVTARNLIQFHFEKFIRRLSVIMVEDLEYIHDPFQTIIWLMCCKRKQWPLFVFEWLLGIVNLMCSYPIYKNGYQGLEPNTINAKIINEFQMSVQVRRSWGMLQSDLSMFGRLLSIEKPFVKTLGKYQYIDLKSIQPLTLDLIKHHGLFAIDHHCSNILDLIHDETKLPKSEIKMIMWTNQGSINTRDRTNRRSKNYLYLKPTIQKAATRILFNQQMKCV